MRGLSRPSSLSDESNREPNYNIWGTQQPSRQGRPSSFDNIWTNTTQSNIWSGNSGQSNMPISSPPEFLSYTQQQQQSQQPQPTLQSFSSSYGNIPSFGTRDSIQFGDHSDGINQFDFNLRRHSYGDVHNYNMNAAPGQNLNPLLTQPQLLGQSNYAKLNSTDDLKNSLELVNEYFEVDPHERVKVTVKFLNERFFDEEKYLGDSYQLPKFPVESSLRNYQLVLVGFKAGRIDVFYLPQSGANGQDLSNLKLGDLVIVEADRGRDLGKIFKMNISIDEARLLKLLQFQEQQASLNEDETPDLSVKSMSECATGVAPSGMQNPPTLHFPKSVISLAQPNEIVQILNKKQDEEKACRLCLAKIANSTGLLNTAGGINVNQSDLMQMKLIDAEYQFDRKKLIFYYSTSKRIDFRDLVRELFRIYKTRIWMCAVIGLPYIPNQNYSQIRQGSQMQTSKFITSPIMTSPSMINSPFTQQTNQPAQMAQNSSLFQYQTPDQAAGQMPNQFSGPFSQNGPTISKGPKLNDPFKQPISSVPKQQPNPMFDRRFSYPQMAFNEQPHIPRNFPKSEDPNFNIDRKDDNGGESFVLKSLVDSINH